MCELIHTSHNFSQFHHDAMTESLLDQWLCLDLPKHHDRAASRWIGEPRSSAASAASTRAGSPNVPSALKIA